MAHPWNKIRVRQHTTKPAPLTDKSELQDMVKAAYNLVVRAVASPSAEYKTEFFGYEGYRKSTTVDARARKLKDFLECDRLFELCFVCAAENDICGSDKKYTGYAGGWEFQRLPTKPWILLGVGFRGTRYSWGEKVCAILHELTHIVTGTVDVEYKGVEIYGLDRCMVLAENAPHKAFQNADNWTYYFGSYRHLTPEANRDWKYFTDWEVAGRRLKTEHEKASAGS